MVFSENELTSTRHPLAHEDRPVTTSVDRGQADNEGPVQHETHEEHQVAMGESLWSIAEDRYGDGRLWPVVAQANPQIDDPDLILPGEIVRIPILPVHTVQAGESLWSIAARLLGDPLRWPELRVLNPEITNPDLIKPEQPIRLPVGTPIEVPDTATPLGSDLDVVAMLVMGGTIGPRREAGKRPAQNGCFMASDTGALRPYYGTGGATASDDATACSDELVDWQRGFFQSRG